MARSDLTALQTQLLGLDGNPGAWTTSSAQAARPSTENEAPDLDALLGTVAAALQQKARKTTVHPQRAQVLPSVPMFWKASLLVLVLSLVRPFMRLCVNRHVAVVTLDPHNSDRLKDVLFGGEPWLIYCTNENTVARGAPIPMSMEQALQPHHVPQALDDARIPLWQTHGVRVGLLPCWEKLESGRSVAERFNLQPEPPLLFFVANGEAPKTINMIGLSESEELVTKVVPWLKVTTSRIDTVKQWQSMCTSRRACVVIGHKTTAQRDSALAVFRPLLESNRGVKVVTLDTAQWRLKLDDALMEARPGKSAGRAASVICLARSTVSAGEHTYSGKFLQDLDSNSASNLLTDCVQRVGLVSMSTEPLVVSKTGGKGREL